MGAVGKFLNSLYSTDKVRAQYVDLCMSKFLDALDSKDVDALQRLLRLLSRLLESSRPSKSEPCSHGDLFRNETLLFRVSGVGISPPALLKLSALETVYDLRVSCARAMNASGKYQSPPPSRPDLLRLFYNGAGKRDYPIKTGPAVLVTLFVLITELKDVDNGVALGVACRSSIAATKDGTSIATNDADEIRQKRRRQPLDTGCPELPVISIMVGRRPSTAVKVLFTQFFVEDTIGGDMIGANKLLPRVRLAFERIFRMFSSAPHDVMTLQELLLYAQDSMINTHGLEVLATNNELTMERFVEALADEAKSNVRMAYEEIMIRGLADTFAPSDNVNNAR